MNSYNIQNKKKPNKNQQKTQPKNGSSLLCIAHQLVEHLPEPDLRFCKIYLVQSVKLKLDFLQVLNKASDTFLFF